MSRATTMKTLCAAAVLLTTAVPMSTQMPEEKEGKEPKRPSLSLKATPGTGMVPVRISATAEFKGGDDYRIFFRLKLKDRILVSQSTAIRLLGGGF